MAKRSQGSFPLLSYSDELVEAIRGHIPRAVKLWDRESIHHARVATRRLKAAMDVLKPVLSDSHRKPFGSTLGKIRRRFGPLRDVDVMLTHLQDLGSGPTAAGVGWLLQRFKARQEELRETVSRKIVPAKLLARLGTWWGVREELAECHQAVDTLLAESLHLQLDAFVERAEAVIHPKEPDPQDLAATDPHQLRIAGKALRYTLEMAVVEGHRLPTEVTRAFKQMQDALGLWHDYVVLAERIMEVSLEEQLPHHDATMQAAVLDVAKTMVRRSSKQMDRFAVVWSRRGEELAGVIRKSFP